ncbi:hypothetical protein T4A_29 [Trichinella pseudospiralis]|uniref:Uncharacterized protein n=1 Tax=Trichinella pseudospiralis TaxID=6337 RepID=A0A0V1DWG0_TRIPS|nr:hypothetical protein T4A_29 [Trichinella pseudospiralis]
MANMPGVVLEIFKASGGWRDQKWAPPRSFLVAVETCPPSSPAPLSPPPPLPRGLPTASSPPNPCAVLHDFR